MEVLYLVFTALVGISLTLLYFCTKKGSSKLNVKEAALIPGWKSQPAHPQLGDLEAVRSLGGLHSYLSQRHKEEDSPILAFWWKKTRVVSVCSLRAFKETEHLYNRPPDVFEASSAPLDGPKSIQNTNDMKWEQRKKLLYQTVRGDFVVEFVDVFWNVAKDTCSILRSRTEVQVVQFAQVMTLKAVIGTCLGNVFENDSELETMRDSYHFCKCDMDKRFEGIQQTDTTQETEYQLNLQQVKEYINKMITVRREKIGSQSLPLLDALLSSDLPEETIIDDIMTFLGGFHTSGYYLSWTLIFLAQNPAVQTKLANEINETLGDGGNMKAYVLSSGTYLRQVLNESLRLSGTAPQTAHYSNSDLEVEGYLIPAHTPIIHCMGMAMMDERIWPNPQEFNPERFTPGSKPARLGREFRPFGVSVPRRCPANQFTYTMISVFVCQIIREFVVDLSGEFHVTKKRGFVTTPMGTTTIVVKPREKDK